jgi:nucleoporin NUP82
MFWEDEDLEEDVDDGLSVGVICFMTTSGRISICLDLDGVEAQWLPKSKLKSLRLMEEPELPSLMTFEVMDLLKSGEPWDGNWPVFSSDTSSRYSFFVTDTSSISFISLQHWAFRLEQELNKASAGSDFRLNLLANGQNSTRERLFTQKSGDHSAPLAACEVFQDADLGYFLLSSTPYKPVAIEFEAETPEPAFEFRRSTTRSPTYDPEPDRPLILCEPRPTYEPPNSLTENSGIPAFLEQLGRSRYARLLKEEVRLSPATLQIMTEAHKVLSEETHRVSAAAAELFRRCERLQIDLQSQIKKANEVATRVEQVTGDDNDEGPLVTKNEAIEKRLKDATERQVQLVDRIDKMKRKVMKGSSRPLSDKEMAWVEEVRSLEKKVLGQGEGEVSRSNAKEPWARYEEITTLKDELLEQVGAIKVDESVIRSPNVKVPSEIRKAKLNQVMGLLDRETALVEGAKSRLERLNLA